MKLAIFDLDNTLLDGDINAFWGRFLVEENLIAESAFFDVHQKFHQEYLSGTLKIEEYLCFTLGVLSEHDIDSLLSLRDRFIAEKVKPKILPKAIELVESHQSKGHLCIIITASNRFIAEPVSEFLGMHTLIASEPEIVDNKFTGKVSGIPSYQEGKISRLETWLAEQSLESVSEKIFYSDSHNDIPLLENVDTAIAVDPDELLQQEAMLRGWPIISLK